MTLVALNVVVSFGNDVARLSRLTLNQFGALPVRIMAACAFSFMLVASRCSASREHSSTLLL